jgi:hypothetical protein
VIPLEIWYPLKIGKAINLKVKSKKLENYLTEVRDAEVQLYKIGIANP